MSDKTTKTTPEPAARRPVEYREPGSQRLFGRYDPESDEVQLQQRGRLVKFDRVTGKPK